jgi:hypothetical protein
MKAGAYDVVTNPFGMDELKLLLKRVAAHLTLKVENRRLCAEIRSKQGFGNIIGRAPEMDRLYRIIAAARDWLQSSDGQRRQETIPEMAWRRCTARDSAISRECRSC